MFTASITLPDAGPLTQTYPDIDSTKKWLLSCLRMDGDPATLKVTYNGIDLTDLVGKELTQILSRDNSG